MKELSTCPFYGHKASICQTHTETAQFNPVFSVNGFGSVGYNTKKTKIKYLVRCNKCKAPIGPYTTEKQAIESWNKRIKEK